MKTIICLSFIVVLNNFLQTSVKKNCASPTKSLTARHWSLPTNNLKGGLLHLKNHSMEKVVLILR